jgi:SAM-dependent methyltransferase
MSSDIGEMYRSDEYISKNPDLFSFDSPWKANQAWPYIEHAVLQLKKPAIALLDVGGGAGEILKIVSERIASKHSVRVHKYLLDMSPGILEVQRKANPDFVRSLNEDVAHTSLADKEIDLALLLDVLEHVADPAAALREIRRVSHWAVLKVPLEDNLYFNLLNLKSRGRFRKKLAENLGHITVYNYAGLKRQVEANSGKVMMSGYTNAYSQFLHSPAYQLSFYHRMINRLAACLYPLSPGLCARVFNDFIMMLVDCDTPLSIPLQ